MAGSLLLPGWDGQVAVPHLGWETLVTLGVAPEKDRGLQGGESHQPTLPSNYSPQEEHLCSLDVSCHYGDLQVPTGGWHPLLCLMREGLPAAFSQSWKEPDCKHQTVPGDMGALEVPSSEEAEPCERGSMQG